MPEVEESLSKDGTKDQPFSQDLQKILMTRIKTDVMSVRVEISHESIIDLAQSIARLGLLNPISVCRCGDGFVVVAGHRRFAAVESLGWERIPAIILEGSESQKREAVFAENFFRENVTPVEQACAIKDAIESGNATIEQVASGFSRSTHWVRAQIAMLEWPDDCIDALQSGSMSVSAVQNLAIVNEQTYREYLVRLGIEQGATARTTASWLQAWQSQMPQEEAVEQPPVNLPQRQEPMVPQAPCFLCGQYTRYDALSNVPVCVECITQVKKSQQA